MKKHSNNDNNSKNGDNNVMENNNVIMMTESYPRTPHLPFSPCIFDDDIKIKDTKALTIFETNDIIITEKIDGGNACIHPSKGMVYARTHNAEAKHPSFSPIKELCQILHYENLPANLKLFGENVFGIHSIEYDNLKSFFYLFAVQEGDRWYSWKEVADFALKYDLMLPPILYMGKGLKIKEIETLMNKAITLKSGLATDTSGTKPEGFVVRIMDSYKCNDFENKVAKYVRKNHVQTNETWRRTWKKAKLNL